jgi:hypothetical protein
MSRGGDFASGNLPNWIVLSLLIFLGTATSSFGGETTRVSVDSLGNQGNAASLSPAISAAGRFVAFHSWASNLVAGDTNGTRDVFVHDRQTFSDADGDGIPDDSDPDVLSDFLETLPDGAFKRNSGRLRTPCSRCWTMSSRRFSLATSGKRSTSSCASGATSTAAGTAGRISTTG